MPSTRFSLLIFLLVTLTGCGIQKGLQGLNRAINQGSETASISAQLGSNDLQAEFQLVRINPEGSSTIIRRWEQKRTGERKTSSPVRIEPSMRYFLSARSLGSRYAGSAFIQINPSKVNHYFIEPVPIESCRQISADQSAFGSPAYWDCSSNK